MDREVKRSGVTMCREKAIEEAKRLLPGMRQRAEQCAQDRSVSTQAIQELKDAGLIKLMQPRRYGGYELGRDVVCEVLQVLAQGCGSQAWVYHVLADHAWMLGTYSPEAQDDVWGKDTNVLISSSFAPVGRAVPVDGGYRCTGRHGFSSGIDHADWVACGAVIEGSNEIRHCLIPKIQGSVVDDWSVNGLEGTGSKSFKVEDIFVPEHRTLRMADAVMGKGPGAAVNTSPLYRAPRFGYTSGGFTALVLGMAKGLQSEWLSFTARRGGPNGAAKKESMQIVAGHAATEIDAAEALYLDAMREGTLRIFRGEDLSQGPVHEIRGRIAFAAQLVLSASVRMYHASGASMLYRGNAMERQFRNILAGVQHTGIDWPTGAAGYGDRLFQNTLIEPGQGQ